MYSIIYDFILNNLFNDTGLANYSTEILGVTTNMNVWISHTLTIIAMVLFYIFLVIFIKWVFKLTAGLITFR